MKRPLIILIVLSALLASAAAASARVLRVGAYHGKRGQFSSIQAAVNAARPGDWILVGPGDYKEHAGRAPAGFPDRTAGVLITKSGLRLRGMNRNTVIVDGTKPGSKPCSNAAGAQEFGPAGLHAGDGPLGLNGIMVWKANNVWVQNLTACNYLHGSGATGNEIWWNGGDGSGQIGGWGYLGSYLSATSTFFNGEDTAAQYGIFSSNWDGGTWSQTYTSNFNDSGYYIGAGQHVCQRWLLRPSEQRRVCPGQPRGRSSDRLLPRKHRFERGREGRAEGPPDVHEHAGQSDEHQLAVPRRGALRRADLARLRPAPELPDRAVPASAARRHAPAAAGREVDAESVCRRAGQPVVPRSAARRTPRDPRRSRAA